MTRHAWIKHAAIGMALVFGFGTAAAHAATQSAGETGSLHTIDTTSLAGNQPATLAPAQATMSAMPSGLPAAALVVQAHAEVLRPAPVPDQDFDAPGPSRQTLAAQEQASVQPSFYSAPRQNFSGDGFAPGSTLNDDHANRSRPGGGMSLSIPVQ